MRQRAHRWKLRALVAVLGLACGRPPTPADPGSPAAGRGFSGAAAHARLAALMQLPRALGDPRRAASIDALAELLRAAGASSVERLEHSGEDPWTGERFAMTTLIGSVRPAASQQFVLASHFDVRPWAESDPDPARRDRAIPGANDGSSGVAVLLELAPLLLAQLPAEVGFSVILFDGEELGRPGVGPYCAGSRALADALVAGRFPGVRAARFGVVLDMVGDRDLQLLQEPNSRRAAPELLTAIWSAGQAAGHRQFVATPMPQPLIDDHVPLTRAGVPSILIIDYSYPPWHTHADDLDQVAASSLEAVGETLRVALRARWP
jgi:glutaminyl-peptide cyclotransferase